MTTEWDYFTPFCVHSSSVALVGFGDAFPSEPRIILVNVFFLVMGVVLFSTFYFILKVD
ncbi:hypothetical protein AAVH_42318 [Aphelenchoides avenae]|nr:hypothetical protein AAVH_42318 [Aphelenchus avenae]